MSKVSRPVFPIVLSDESAATYIRELTGWVGPGFHPDTDFRDYVSENGTRSYSNKEADELNSELAAAASMLERSGIDPCEVALPVQRRLIQQMM